MFQRGTQTKIIMVIEYPTLQAGRGNSFPEVANRLATLFPKDFDRLINSIMLLVTKVPLSMIKEQEIIEEIEEINSTNKNMEIKCKTMIERIVAQRNIFIMPIPSDMNVGYIQKLKAGIVTMRPTMLSRDATISLSWDAKSMLENLSNELASSII